MFELVIGELDLILGILDSSKSFEDLVRQAWEKSQDDNELAQQMAAIGEAIETARHGFESIRESSALLNVWLED